MIRPQKRASKEVLPVNNILAILVVLFTITSVISSYNAYQNSKNTLQEMTGEVVTDGAQARLCVNKQPSIVQNCSAYATVGTGYYCDVDSIDPDNDTIVFNDNTSLFDIDTETGEIIFTPAAGDVGTHNILVTALDGKGCSNSNAFFIFTITISEVPGIIPPSGGGGGGSGGGGSDGEPAACTPLWDCTPWSSCRIDDTRTRTCYTLNNCPENKPPELEECIYILPPLPRKFKYSQFDFCDFDNEEECLRNVGIREDWFMTYKGTVYVLNFDSITDTGMEISIDDLRYISLGMKRIKPIDIDLDGADDFDLIYHSVSGVRGDVTGKLIRQVESVREKPVYIEVLPWWITALLVFVYNNACIIAFMVIILASIMIYTELMDRVEGKKQEKK